MDIPNILEKKEFTLKVDGSEMACYAAWPCDAEDPLPGIIVFPEIFGVNQHIQGIVKRLAARGYMAIAPDLFHRSEKNYQGSYDEESVAHGRKLKEECNLREILDDTTACIDWIYRQKDSFKGGVGTLGFCFGGHVAFIAATLSEVKVTASVYGAGIARTCPGREFASLSLAEKIKGKIHLFFGEQDPLIPQEDVEEIYRHLKATGTKFEISRYDAGHGYCCEERDDFVPAAARATWKKIHRLFDNGFVDNSKSSNH